MLCLVHCSAWLVIEICEVEHGKEWEKHLFSKKIRNSQKQLEKSHWENPIFRKIPKKIGIF